MTKQFTLRDKLIEQLTPIFPKLDFEKDMYSLNIFVLDRKRIGTGETLGKITYEMMRDEMNDKITFICEEAEHSIA